MAVPDSARKAASLAIIATLFCASAWLPDAPSFPVETLPSRALVTAVAVPPAVGSGVGRVSDRGQRQDLVRSRFRVDSEREYGATQGLGTSEVAELRTRSFPAALTATPAAISSDGLAAADREPADPAGRAFMKAGRETRGALVAAGRAIRTAFVSVRF